jgi:poly [ADP-ribose] polymerase
VATNYIQSTCTPSLINEARDYLTKMKNMTSLIELNEMAIKVFTSIPRKMSKVQNHLLTTPSDKTNFINNELDMLESMDSSNIIHTNNTDTLSELNISFRECNSVEYSDIEKLIMPTAPHRTRIHKCYAVINTNTQKNFDDWLNKSKDKRTQILMHGTRNANIFSIAKSGLFVRPPKGTTTTGSNYGYGIYHSAHTGKSLNYTGYDSDSIFFLQDVHIGKQYSYDGWYEDGKDKVFKTTNDLSYKGMQNVGCDSLYVVARRGGRLMNSEYVVYNAPQTTVKYIVWFK